MAAGWVLQSPQASEQDSTTPLGWRRAGDKAHLAGGGAPAWGVSPQFWAAGPSFSACVDLTGTRTTFLADMGFGVPVEPAHGGALMAVGACDGSP